MHTNDFQQAISGNQLTLVDFYATWCGPCQTMQPILERLKGELQNDIQIIKVDVDQNRNLSTFYSVLSVPTLMLFREGKSIWRHTGIMSLFMLKQTIKQFK